ncbi:unnamed protein product [Mytilus coruscus]|uniref:Uncharacterized protein n=1 Tax=Mytilus coruscus TaxID=42192 RepID=A0A6J8DAM0_MYTCO|nr:unnamed protein product [Mytilus coruscus]
MNTWVLGINSQAVEVETIKSHKWFTLVGLGLVLAQQSSTRSPRVFRDLLIAPRHSWEAKSKASASLLNEYGDSSQQGALEMSSDESAGGSPNRNWAAEKKREEKRGVERDTPSLRDTKGQEGEAEVQGEAISGDHRDPSPKAGDTSLEWGSGAVGRSTRDGSPNSREGLGQVVGREQLGTPVEEGADAPFPGVLQGPLSQWPGTPLWAFQPTGMLTAHLHWVGAFKRKRRQPRKGRGIGKKNALQRKPLGYKGP